MREMKDSGVRWIGKIPTKWTIAKAKNCVEIQNGSDPKTEGSIPVYGSGSMSFKTCGEYKEGPSVLIGRKGATLHIPHYISSRFWNVDTAFNVYSKSIFDLKYYFYCAHVFDYTLYMSQTTLPSMTQTAYENMFLPLPTKEEQYAIANQLDQICSKIDAVLEKTRASIEEYKKLKQTVITQAVTRGIRGDRPMKDSGIEWIGEIPAEWDVVRQKYFWNTVESGVSVNAADKPVDNSEQYGVLKTSAVSKFVFIPTEHKQVNLEEYGRVSCPVRPDSIIASRMNTPELVGACGYVQNNYPNLFLPDRLWQITFKNGLSPKYAWYYLSGIRVRQYISSLSTGTSSSMQNISQSQYGNIFITIPSIGEQSEITKYLDEKCRSVDALVTKKQQYLTEIENYKKSLIYEYVTGKKEAV